MTFVLLKLKLVLCFRRCKEYETSMWREIHWGISVPKITKIELGLTKSLHKKWCIFFTQTVYHWGTMHHSAVIVMTERGRLKLWQWQSICDVFELSRFEPTGLSHLGHHAGKYHELQLKAKTTDELKVALQKIWEELPQEHVSLWLFSVISWNVVDTSCTTHNVQI